MSTGSFNSIETPVTIIHANVDQEVIVTTDDKLRIALNEYLKKAEDRKSWIGPFGVFLAVVTAFVTADFKKFVFEAAVWQALFVGFGIVSLVWFVISAFRSFNAPGVEDLISQIKKSRSNSGG